MAIKTGRLRLILPNGEERVYGSADGVAPQVPAGESSLVSSGAMW
jgi:hypothetical protein